MYDFFYLSSYHNFFFSSSFIDKWFLNRIHLYTWSAQQVILAHMGCFLKKSYFPMFFPIYHFNFIPQRQMVFFSSHIWPTFQTNLDQNRTKKKKKGKKKRKEKYQNFIICVEHYIMKMNILRYYLLWNSL